MPTPSAHADVSPNGCQIIYDNDQLLSRELLSYAEVAACEDLDDLSFVWRHPIGALLQVSITTPPTGARMRELTVEPATNECGLTQRELEVLTLVVGGLTNPEIADILKSRPKTVTTHVAHILLKLSQSSRSGAVAAAIGRGLILLPVPVITPALANLPAGQLQEASREGRGSPQEHSPPRPHPLRRVKRSPLRIGSLIPANLPLEATDMRQGGLLATLQANERGGVAGRLVEHVPLECDVFDTDAMRTGLDELATLGLDALVFGYNLDYPRMGQFLEAVADFGFPAIHASTSSLAGDYVSDNPAQLGSIFHICGGDRRYGSSLVRLLRLLSRHPSSKLRRRRIAAIDPPPGMVVLEDDWEFAANRLGWRVDRISRPSAISTAAQRDAIVAQIGQIDPDVILAATFLDEALLVTVLMAARVAAANPLVYSLYTPALAGFVQRNSGLAEGLVWSTQTGSYHDRLGDSFRNSFRQSFGREPGASQASVNYDAVKLLLRAWAEVEHPRRFGEVCSQLREVIHRGVNGVYWLGNHEQMPVMLPDQTLDASIAQAQLILQIQGGTHRIVSPEPYVEAPLIWNREPVDQAG